MQNTESLRLSWVWLSEIYHAIGSSGIDFEPLTRGQGGVAAAGTRGSVLVAIANELRDRPPIWPADRYPDVEAIAARLLSGKATAADWRYCQSTMKHAAARMRSRFDRARNGSLPPCAPSKALSGDDIYPPEDRQANPTYQTLWR